jgi:hypothetical protein
MWDGPAWTARTESDEVRRRPLRRTGRLDRRTPIARRARLARRTPLRRSAVRPASQAQREKVRPQRCVACGAATRIDPAHLVPRSLGGCDDPDCVVALCRSCHRAYDGGRLELLPHLEPGHRKELAHGLLHIGLIGLTRRVTRAAR